VGYNIGGTLNILAFSSSRSVSERDLESKKLKCRHYGVKEGGGRVYIGERHRRCWLVERSLE
jgi:hypothetical protein